MFPQEFFPNRFFARRYFPKSALDPVLKTGVPRIFATSVALGAMASSSGPRSYGIQPGAFQELKAASGGGYTGPLDIVPGAVVAYGQRALSAAKRGSALETLRRSSDDTTQSFSSDATTGAINAAAASAFIGGGSGFGTLWNDQSGNSYDVTQGTAANQPLWVPNVANGQPGLKGTAQFVDMLSPVIALPGGAMTAFSVVSADTADAPSVIAFVQNVVGNFIQIEMSQFYNVEGDVTVTVKNADGNAGAEWATSGTVSNGTHLYEMVIDAAGNVTVLVDGVDLGATLQFGIVTAVPAQSVLFQNPYGLGVDTSIEKVVYLSQLSAPNRAAIRANMKAWYGTP